MHFNTMVSSYMEYVNLLTTPAAKAEFAKPQHAELAGRVARALVLILAPVTPHLSEELWEAMGETSSVHTAAWPTLNPALLVDDEVQVIVQVNGKVRATVSIETAADETVVVAAARAQPNVAKYLESASLVKTVFVPGKLVNFVVKT
jgi:leucyl-tRNA synthetase